MATVNLWARIKCTLGPTVAPPPSPVQSIVQRVECIFHSLSLSLALSEVSRAGANANAVTRWRSVHLNNTDTLAELYYMEKQV